MALGQSAEDFFKTASLSMYVGSGGGGGYDAIARLVARHMSRYLPGNPNFVIKNMPTAAGVASANFIYNSAPRDGSAILAAQNASLMLPLYNSPVAHYDPRKFEWIGSTDKQQAICVTWIASPIKTLAGRDQARRPGRRDRRERRPGRLPENPQCAVRDQIQGHQRLRHRQHAAGGGEGRGRGHLRPGLADLQGHQLRLDREPEAQRPGADWGWRRTPELPDVPLAIDLLKNPDDRKVLELIVLPQEFGRPFVAPPGVPADRMAIYRKAFQAVLEDAQFRAESAKQRLSIEPLDDRQIQALLERAYAAPKPIHDRAAVFSAEMN